MMPLIVFLSKIALIWPVMPVAQAASLMQTARIQ
jgi:hypothetical protein